LSLEKDVAIIRSAFAGYNVGFFFVESDSQDNTLHLLDKLKEKISDFSYVSLGKIEEVIPDRIARIAYCRNVYIEELRNRLYTEDTEFTVVADMDGINSKLSRTGVESCFILENWSVCTANQRGPYYDIYALRARNWNLQNLPESYQHHLEKYRFHAIAFYLSVVRKMFKYRGKNPIEVESAFGGIAIYKTDVLRNFKYSETNQQGTIECEHVGLHRAIREDGGKIIINPNFINAGWTRNAQRTLLKLIGVSLLGRRYYYLKDIGF
jgi:hypothetical protein